MFRTFEGTHRPPSSSVLWFIFRILQGTPKKELLMGLWVVISLFANRVRLGDALSSVFLQTLLAVHIGGKFFLSAALAMFGRIGPAGSKTLIRKLVILRSGKL